MSTENLDREHLEKEFKPFLTPEAEGEVKGVAINYFLGLTGSDEGKKLIGESDVFLHGVVSLTEDSDSNIKVNAYKTLINVATIPQICERIASHSNFTNFITRQLQEILDPTSAHADDVCKFVSNLTRSEDCAAKVTKAVLLNPDSVGVVKIVSALCNLQYNCKANLHYLAPILANLTQIKSIRSEVLARDQLVIQKLIPFVEFQDSAIRRHGVVSCIRNCCFEPGE